MIGPAGVIPSGGRFQLRRPILNQIILTSPLDSARLALGPGTANIYISSFKQTGLWTWHSQKIHHFIQKAGLLSLAQPTDPSLYSNSVSSSYIDSDGLTLGLNAKRIITSKTIDLDHKK